MARDSKRPLTKEMAKSRPRMSEKTRRLYDEMNWMDTKSRNLQNREDVKANRDRMLKMKQDIGGKDKVKSVKTRKKGIKTPRSLSYRNVG